MLALDGSPVPKSKWAAWPASACLHISPHPTQCPHCKLLQSWRTAWIFMADLTGILYSLALQNLPKNRFRYCSLCSKFPTSRQLLKSLPLTLQPPHHFAAFTSSLPCSLQCWCLILQTMVLFHLIAPRQSWFITCSPYSNQVPQTLWHSEFCCI